MFLALFLAIFVLVLRWSSPGSIGFSDTFLPVRTTQPFAIFHMHKRSFSFVNAEIESILFPMAFTFI